LAFSSFIYANKPTNKVVNTLGGGVLTVRQGGTGATTFTNGECLKGNGTGAVTTGSCGTGTGTETDPIWIASSTNYYTKALSDGRYDVLGQATSTLGSHTTTYNHSNYNTAYSWGNHATAGYETQAQASSSFSLLAHNHGLLYDFYGQATSTLASHTSTYNHTNYNTAYSWGNHAGLYDVLGQATSTLASHTTAYNHASFLTAVASDATWTLHNSYPSACSAGQYVTAIGDTLTCSTPPVGGTETDPVWLASSTNYYTKSQSLSLFDVLGQATSTLSSHTTTYNHANYNTAYGWGNHATYGYETQAQASSSFSLLTHNHGLLYDFYGQATSTLASHNTAYNHASFLTAVGSDSTWTQHNSYPAACSAGEYVTAIGDTLTCSTPAGGPGGSQTPWTQNIDAAYYSLSSTSLITIMSSTDTGYLEINSNGIFGNSTTTDILYDEMDVYGYAPGLGSGGVVLINEDYVSGASLNMEAGNIYDSYIGLGGVEYNMSAGGGSFSAGDISVINPLDYYSLDAGGFSVSAGNVIDNSGTSNWANGASLSFEGGFVDDTGTWNGGSVLLTAGDSNSGVGSSTVNGSIYFMSNSSSGSTAKIDTSLLTSSRRYYFPNISGTFAVIDDTGRLTVSNASTSVLTVIGSTTIQNLNKANCDVKADASGGLYCGLDATGGGGLTGTTGQIAYFSGTNTAVGTSSVYIKFDGTMGIGTTTPDDTLAIVPKPGVNPFEVYNEQSESKLLVDKNGYITVAMPKTSNAVPPTTTLNEPWQIPSITATNYMSTFSDDINRLIECGTAAGSNVYIRNGGFAQASQKYISTGAMTITFSSLLTANVVGRGCMTTQGYHYVGIASTTNSAYSIIKRIQSSDTVAMNSAPNWATSTISGATLPTSFFLIGASDGYLWIGTSTTDVAKFSIATSTNTLTYDGGIRFSGTNILINNTRVNNNGIYVGFSAAPYTRKYTLAGVAVSNITNIGAAVPATTGPDMFATPYSLYGLYGNSTTMLTKIVGY
jgi:hypothetical protein